MSTAGSASVLTAQRRGLLNRRSLHLAYATAGYNLLEGIVAVAAGLANEAQVNGFLSHVVSDARQGCRIQAGPVPVGTHDVMGMGTCNLSDVDR